MANYVLVVKMEEFFTKNKEIKCKICLNNECRIWIGTTSKNKT